MEQTFGRSCRFQLAGRVGILLSLPVNQNLLSSDVELVRLTFSASNVPGSVTVRFSYTPAPESASDSLGNDLAAQSIDGVVTIPGLGNRLEAIRVGQKILLTWPTNAPGSVLESTTNLALGGWSAAGGAPAVTSGVNTVTIPVTGVARFYRLRGAEVRFNGTGSATPAGSASLPGVVELRGRSLCAGQAASSLSA